MFSLSPSCYHHEVPPAWALTAKQQGPQESSQLSAAADAAPDWVETISCGHSVDSVDISGWEAQVCTSFALWNSQHTYRGWGHLLSQEYSASLQITGFRVEHSSPTTENCPLGSIGAEPPTHQNCETAARSPPGSSSKTVDPGFTTKYLANAVSANWIEYSPQKYGIIGFDHLQVIEVKVWLAQTLKTFFFHF